MRWRGMAMAAVALGLALVPVATATTTTVFTHHGEISTPDCSVCTWADEKFVQPVEDELQLVGTQGSDDGIAPDTGDQIGSDTIEGALSNGGNYYFLRLTDSTVPDARISLVFYDRHGFPLEGVRTYGTASGFIPNGAEEAVVYLDLGLQIEYDYAELYRDRS